MIGLFIFMILFFTSLAFAVTERRPPASASRFARAVSLLARASAAGIVIFPFGLILISILFAPRMGGIRYPVQSNAMQSSRSIALAMFQYANDNNDVYPDGASSTEVFQELIDGNYVSDPAVFYVPLPGKKPGHAGEKLKPENVAYDVTSDVNGQSPDDLPVVFLTGFRMDYRPGGNATSLVRPFPTYAGEPTCLWDDIFGIRPTEEMSGLPMAYKSNNAFFRNGQVGPDGMGFVPHVVPDNFDARGKTYHQLTPEGVLK
jgi:hypothetical protein